jgi:hypothetical protein
MEIPAGPRGTYRLAQYDDYTHLSRDRFPHVPPLTLRQAQGNAISLRARVSAADLPGTWGFGLWNDPFGLSLGFGGTASRLPALPQAAWFFYGSKENHLSLRGGSSSSERSEERIETRRHRTRRVGNPLADREIASGNPQKAGAGDRPRNDTPANGFFAGTFRSPSIPSLLLAPAALTLPLLPIRPISRWLRRLTSKIILQSGIPVEVDVTKWHEYKIEWQRDGCSFFVDGQSILVTPISPRGRLGLVIWIDNQYAFWRPDGRAGWGTLENPKAWMEIEGLDI